MKLYKLESVGAVIDQFGVTYPMLANGQPDWDQGMELPRVDAGEWWEHLSDYDKSTALFVWYVARKVWWNDFSPADLSEPPSEHVVEELKGRESDIPLLPPTALVGMLKFGG